MSNVITVFVRLLLWKTLHARCFFSLLFPFSSLPLFIASQLLCPQCQNQNLLESNAPVAVSMRHQVYTMVAEGKNEAEITAWMTRRYGDFVRYNPPLAAQTLLLWALPCLLLLLVGIILWRVGIRQRTGKVKR